MESIARLAESLDAGSIVAEPAVKPLVNTGEPAHSSPAEAARLIRTIDENDSWLTLLNIEQSPSYRRFIDSQFDALAAVLGEPAAALRQRMGFVFVSSPNSTTPAHFDIEQSLLIQLRGNRRLDFGSWASAAHRDDEVHRYWTGSLGRLESMPEGTDALELGPGRGAYIPPYTPHWLQNGDTASLSLTITFFNRDNRDESFVQVFNEKLRRARLSPPAYGSRPGTDRAKAGVMRGYTALKRRVRPERSAGR